MNEAEKAIQIHAVALELEAQGDIETAEKIYAENPWALNYDPLGNWVGAVAHENGWTP